MSHVIHSKFCFRGSSKKAAKLLPIFKLRLRRKVPSNNEYINSNKHKRSNNPDQIADMKL